MELRFKIGENQYKTINISELAEFRENNPGAILAPMESDDAGTQADASKVEDKLKYLVGDSVYNVDKRDNINFLQKHGISNAKLISSPKYQKTESKVNLNPYEGFELPSNEEMEQATKGWFGLRKEEGLTNFLNDRLKGTGVRAVQKHAGKDVVELLFDDQMPGEGVPINLENQTAMTRALGQFFKGPSAGVPFNPTNRTGQQGREIAFENIRKIIKDAANPEKYEEDVEEYIKIMAGSMNEANPNFSDVETDFRSLSRNEFFNNTWDRSHYKTTNPREIIEEQQRLLAEGVDRKDIPIASWQRSNHKDAGSHNEALKAKGFDKDEYAHGGVERIDWIGTYKGTLFDTDKSIGPISPGKFGHDQQYTFSPRFWFSDEVDSSIPGDPGYHYLEEKKKITEDDSLSEEEKLEKIKELDTSESPVENYSHWRLQEHQLYKKGDVGMIDMFNAIPSMLGIDQYWFDNSGYITINGEKVSLEYLYTIKDDIYNRMEQKQKEVIREDLRNFSNPVSGESQMEMFERLFPEKYKAANGDLDFMVKFLHEQTKSTRADGSRRKGSYYSQPLDKRLKDIQTQREFLEEGKISLSGHLFNILTGDIFDVVEGESPHWSELQNLIQNDLMVKVGSDKINWKHGGTYAPGEMLDVSDNKELITNILKELNKEEDFIKNITRDDGVTKVIPPDAFDLTTGAYKDIEETPIDPTMYVDNGDGSATHVDTGDVIFYGIEEEAKEIAKTTKLEDAQYELVQTYFQLVHSTKLNHDNLKRGVYRESNAFMRLLQGRAEQEAGGYKSDWTPDYEGLKQGLASDIRQYDKFMETGWNIFDLGEGEFDQDVLTTLKSGSARAKHHNALYKKFKTFLRVVDLNQNIAQVPQEEFKKEVKDDFNHFVGGGYFNNEYTDDQAYEVFTGFLTETGHEVPDHMTEGWYGRTDKPMTWSGMKLDFWNDRQMSEFANESVMGLIPLVASLAGFNKLAGFKGLLKMARQGGVNKLNKVSRALVGRDAPKAARWITKNMIVPGALTVPQWGIGELGGQALFGGKHEEQWKATTIDIATGETRLMFPFIMGSVPGLTNLMMGGVGKKLLSSPIGPYIAAVSRAGRRGDIVGGLATGVQQTAALPFHGLNASVLLGIAESAQIITNEALAGNNPFKLDDSPHGKQLREEWNALITPDKIVGTAIAMMVLHGKGVPGNMYKGFTKSVYHWQGWNKSTATSSKGIGLERNSWNKDGWWDQSKVDAAYRNKKKQIQDSTKLTNSEKKKELKQLERDKAQVEHFNNLMWYKKAYKRRGIWNNKLAKIMIAEGSMGRFMDKMETDQDLNKLSRLKQWEFTEMMERMGIDTSSKSFKHQEAWWQVVAEAGWMAEASGIKGKGGEKAKLDFIKQTLEITRREQEILQLEELVKNNPQTSKAKEAEIKLLKDKVKNLLEIRKSKLETFNANWVKMIQRQIALDKAATKAFKDPNLTMVDLRGVDVETTDKDGKKTIVESEYHAHLKKLGLEHFERGKDAEGHISETPIYENGKIKLDKHGVPIYKTEIVINVDKAIETRNLGVGLHELTHYILRNSLKEIRTNKDGSKEKVLSKDGIEVIEDLLNLLGEKERKIVEDRIEKNYKYEVEEFINEKGERDLRYVYEKKIVDGKEVLEKKERPKEQYYEEYITVMGDAMKNGQIKKNMSLGRRLAKRIYPILQNPNNFKGFKDKHGRIPFANWYKFELNQTNSAKAAKDLMNMLSEISGEGITKEIRDAANASGFKITKNKGGEYKDGVLVKLSVSDFINPKPILEKVTHDSKGDILYKGADGKPSHKLFVESGAFKAGEILMKHPSLEPMIRARMQGETAMLNKQEMIDFTASVKMELLERYKGGPKRDSKGRIMLDEKGNQIMRKGYRYDGNPSIFGWLTNYNKLESGQKSSIMYHAKGDVMNKWKEVNKLPTISKDTPIGEKGTIEDLMYADSKGTEAFENQDISISARARAKRAKNEVEYSKLKAQLNLDNTNAKESGIVKAFERDGNFDITGIVIEGPTGEFRQYIPSGAKIIVTEGQKIKINEPLTEGSKITEEFKNEVYDILTDRSTPDFRSRKLTAMLKDGNKTVKEGKIGEIKVIEDQAYLEFKEFEKEFNEKLKGIEKEFNPKIDKAFDKLEFDKADKLTDLKKQKIKALKDYRRSLEYKLNYNMPIYDIKTGKLVFERALASHEVNDLLFKEGDVVNRGEHIILDIKTYLEKAYGEAFRLRVQKMFGVEALYDNFIKSESMEAIWEKMTPEALQKLERLVPQELRKFTTRRRIKDKETVDKLISENIFSKGTDYRTGPWLTEKVSVYPGAEVMSAFFRGVNMKNMLGYEVTPSQLGNRKAALALEVAEIMGLDATMEVLQQQRTVERREHIRELTGKEQLDNQLAVLDLKIKRSPSIKFSITDAKIVGEKIIETSKEEVFKKNEKGEFIPELIEPIGKRIIPKEILKEVLGWDWIEGTGELRYKQSLYTNQNLKRAFREMMLTQRTLNNKNPDILDAQQPYIKKAAEKLATYLKNTNMPLDVVGLQNRIYDPALYKMWPGWNSGKLSSSQKAKLIKENKVDIDGFKLENGKRVKGPYYDFVKEVEKIIEKAKENPNQKENAKNVEIFNSPIGTMKKTRPIMNYYTGNGIKNLEGKDVWGAKEKHAYTESLYGEKINLAGEANLKAYEDMIFDLIKEVELNEKTGGENSKEGIGYDTFYHLMQIQSSLTRGFRGLSKWDFIDFRDYPQGAWRYKNKKGKLEYTFDRGKAIDAWRKANPKLTEQQAIEKAINKDHGLLKEATNYYKNKFKLSQKEAETKALEKINKLYGEHMGAHQNTALDMTLLMWEITKESKHKTDAERRTKIREILKDHNQFLTNSYITDILDIPGSTSREGLNRFNALKKYAPEGNHINNIFTFTKKSIQQQMLEYNLSKLEKKLAKESSTNKKKNDTYEGVWKTQLKTSISGKKRGMSTFDFDDTLGRTKSGVRVNTPNPSGLPKPSRKVIFMAGGAGSGKGNVVNKLNLEQQGFKIVNQDISLEWLKKNSGLPEDMRDFTKEQKSTLGKLGHQARGIAKRKMMKFQGKGDGIVVDGTGGSAKQMEKLVTEFKDKGYDVSMMFVETTLKTALARNKARKERSLLDFIVRKNHEAVQGNKPGFKEMFGKRFMEIKTDNLTMESSMPKKLKDKMNDFISGYERRRLDAEEFALEGESILKRGGEFDFTEFNKVIEGKEGPYLKTAIERAKKFGTKDMFVLTARPAESARSIHEFLKGMGLNIPIENITGLANSSANAKAKWMLEKYAEGYNDMYFVDDALANVDAVKKVLEQIDVKSSVVQAKVQFSQSMNKEFNNMIERKKGVKAGEDVTAFVAKMKGRGIGKWDLYVPPSAEDFKGLIYKIIGEGKQGEADMKFMKETLFKPFAKGIRDLTVVKQKMSEEYKTLKKEFKDVDLNKEIPGTNFTNDLAVRTYLWDKMGYEAPGMSKAEKTTLLNHVNSNPKLVTFAETLSGITRLKNGYIESGEYWMVDNIASDLNTLTRGELRNRFLGEWIQNKDILFSKENMNKIESVYGSGYREALENILYRMENGTNRLVGKNSHVNGFYDWMNGSVGAIMFWNTRSAMLQTISMVNFLDYGSNNIFSATKAFANQPQFWADFKFLFNSPMLKQRRAGLQIDVSASELTNTFGGKKKNLTSYQGIKAVVQMLLRQGFTPTKIADSFAIAAGGAPYYRNRVNKYIKEGKTKAEAEKKAWLDFQEKAEETQQSSRPDLISQQQAGPLGRVILPFQNTPMQMTRLQKKGIMDLYNRRRNPGETQFKSDMSNISKVLYYGAIQNIWFYALQSGLMWAMWGDDQEQIDNKKVRVANGALDTLLRGTGIYGAGASTVKNMIMEYFEQKEKSYGSQDFGKVGLTALDLSPPLGAKIRKVNNAVRTWEYNKGVSDYLPWYSIENPNLHATANVIEAGFNIPVARALNKANNLEEAITGSHQLWERAALTTGWNRWDFGILDEELEEAKSKAKEKRKEDKKIEKDKKKKEDKDKEKEDKEKQGYKTVRCSGTKSNGERCSIMLETKSKSAKCYYHKKTKDGSDSDGDGKKEYRCRAYAKSGYRCKNKTEDKSRKCWNHR